MSLFVEGTPACFFESEPRDEREVLRAVLATNRTFVFSERDVETVVELVLDLPVISNLLGETPRAGRTTRDVVGLSRAIVCPSNSLRSGRAQRRRASWKAGGGSASELGTPWGSSRKRPRISARSFARKRKAPPTHLPGQSHRAARLSAHSRSGEGESARLSGPSLRRKRLPTTSRSAWTPGDESTPRGTCLHDPVTDRN